jgi:hypothetical protein
MGYDSTPETNTFFTCPRTGDTFATKAMALAMVKDCEVKPPVAVKSDPLVIQPGESSPGGLDYRARDADGRLITNQSGSQAWMDASAVEFNQYSLDDPSMAAKAQMSDAVYAYSDAVSRVKAILAGTVDRQISGSTTGQSEFIKAVPQGMGPSGSGSNPQPSMGGSNELPAGTTQDANGSATDAFQQILSAPLVKYALIAIIAVIAIVTVVPMAFGKRVLS